jgi:hypothetical protein
MQTKTQFIQRRDELLAEANRDGVWDSKRYDEIQDLMKRIDLVPDDPIPDQQELDLPEVKPKKAR